MCFYFDVFVLYVIFFRDISVAARVWEASLFQLKRSAEQIANNTSIYFHSNNEKFTFRTVLK